MQAKPFILRKLSPETAKNVTRVGTCCTYLSLICLILFALCSARSRWTLAISIPFLIFTLLGHVSPSRGYIVALIWAMIAGLITPQATALTYLSQASGQQAHLQQQQVQLINLYKELLDRQTMLHVQSLQLQLYLLDPLSGSENATLAEQKTQGLIAQNNPNLAGMRNVISYNTWLLQQNSWTLPTSSSVDKNQHAIQENHLWLTTMQGWLQSYNKRIASNLTVLPKAERIMPHFPTYPATCAGRSACTIPPWQQSISTGWQKLTSKPLAARWPFWFWLIVSIFCAFVLIPRVTRPYQTIYYKKLYYGSRARLIGKIPEEVRVWPDDTQLVKIAIWRPMTTNWRSRSTHQQDRISFNLGLGTSVTSVYATMRRSLPIVRPIRWRTVFNLSDNQQPIKAYYDGTTGTVVVEPGELLPPKALIGPLSRYPLVLYIGAEYFTGDLSANASIPGLQRLQQIHGSPLLYWLTKILNGLNQMLLASGCYIMLTACSYYFFDNAYLTSILKYSLIGTGVFCTVGILVFFLRKLTVKNWQPPAQEMVIPVPTINPFAR